MQSTSSGQLAVYSEGISRRFSGVRDPLGRPPQILGGAYYRCQSTEAIMRKSTNVRPKPHTTAAIKLALDHEARLAELELYKQAVYDLLTYALTPADEQLDVLQVLQTRQQEIEQRWHDDDSETDTSAPAGINSRAGSVRVSKTTS